MKILFTFLLAGLLGWCSPHTHAQTGGTSGLTYTSYYETSGATPLRSTTAYQVASTGTTTWPFIALNNGLFYGASTTNDILVHFTGYLYVPGSGSITVPFYAQADDGVSIALNGSYIINNWQEQGCNCSNGNFNGSYNSSGTATLTGGQYYAIDIWYYNNLGGYGLDIYWNLGSGVTLIPTSSFYQNLVQSYSSSITAGQSAMVNSIVNQMRVSTSSTSNSIYINQTGSGDVINITQVGYANKIEGALYNSGPAGNTPVATIGGGNNNITIRQGDPGSHTGNNLIDLSSIGGSNTLNLNQGTDVNGNYTGLDQGGHYQFDYINGSYNNITIVQENTNAAGNQFSSLSVIGNLNTVGITQTGNAQKQLFASVNGNSNIITTSQTGISKDYLSITATGNGNSAVVTQNNTNASGANAATIILNNNGAPASVNVTQTGGQTYNITQTCVTNCGTVTVKQ
jgi:hypothetical protein